MKLETRRKFFAARFEPVTFSVIVGVSDPETSPNSKRNLTRDQYKSALELADCILRLGALPVCQALGLMRVQHQAKTRNIVEMPGKAVSDIDWEIPKEAIVPDNLRIDWSSLGFSHSWQVKKPTEGSQLYELCDSFRFDGEDITDQVSTAWSAIIETVYDVAKPVLVKGGRIPSAS